MKEKTNFKKRQTKPKLKWKAAKETGEDKKHLKVLKRPRLEVDVENKRFKKETVFCYEDFKVTVTD